MFAKLDASKLKLLAFTSEILTFEDEDIVFHAGDSADCAFVIMEGAGDILTDTESGRTLGTRDFVEYDESAGASAQPSLLSAYREFFAWDAA